MRSDKVHRNYRSAVSLTATPICPLRYWTTSVTRSLFWLLSSGAGGGAM